MKGPTKRPKIGLGLGKLEVAITIAGIVVVIGLLKESGPDLLRAIKEHTWPPPAVIGSFLVTVGVFTEVAIGIFIARTSTREQIESSERISEAEKATADANERAALAIDRATKAEQATAEANLERAKLAATVTRRSVSRLLNGEEESALIEALREYTGQRFTLRLTGARLTEKSLPETNSEQTFFTMQLRRILEASGWVHENIANLPEFTVRKGVTIFSGQGQASEKATSALAVVLAKLEMACQVMVILDLPVPMIIGVGLL